MHSRREEKQSRVFEGRVKSILSGDTLIIWPSGTKFGTVEREITLSLCMAPRMGRPARGNDSAEIKEEVRKKKQKKRSWFLLMFTIAKSKKSKKKKINFYFIYFFSKIWRLTTKTTKTNQLFAFLSREYLRKALVSKKVNFTIDFSHPSGREYGVVHFGDKCVNEMAILRGWCGVKESSDGKLKGFFFCFFHSLF